jgi:Cytoplasmic Fragile-X interacting family
VCDVVSSLTGFDRYSFTAESLQDVAVDLSQLWYREFYLEMTMGKRIQVLPATFTLLQIKDFTPKSSLVVMFCTSLAVPD